MKMLNINNYKINESEKQIQSNNSYYYNKYIDEIKDAILEGKKELAFKDGNCEILINMHYEVNSGDTYHKSSHPYELPSEREHFVSYKNIIVEIETFEDFRLPDITDSWVTFER